MMSEPKRSLKIDLEELKFVMESHFDHMWHYLDLETREFALVTQDARRASEALLEIIAPDISDAEAIAAIETAIQAETVSDSEKAELRAAALVEIGYKTRFIEIPQVDSREGYYGRKLAMWSFAVISSPLSVDCVNAGSTWLG